jgi:hypothetical protein
MRGDVAGGELGTMHNSYRLFKEDEMDGKYSMYMGNACETTLEKLHRQILLQ